MKRHLPLVAFLCIAPAPCAFAQDSVPSSRAFAGTALDAARGRLVLFGGIRAYSPDSVELLDDTWEFDGARWIRLFPPTSPPGRYLHAMAYDQARQRVVLFSGSAAAAPDAGVLSDTWEWDGHNWTRGPDGPTGRVGPLLVYAPVRETLMLSGGIVGDRGTATDHWEYRGVWRRVQLPDSAVALAPAAGPTPTRLIATMRRAVVLGDLRNLAGEQERYFMGHHTYATSLDSLQIRLSPGVTLMIVTATAEGWSATAAHEALPGIRCGLFVGPVPPPLADLPKGRPGCLEPNRR